VGQEEQVSVSSPFFWELWGSAKPGKSATAISGHHKLCDMRVLEVGRVGKTSICCVVVYRLSRCRQMLILWYRLSVVVGAVHVHALAHVDARLTTEWEQRYLEEIMFNSNGAPQASRWPVLRIQPGHRSRVVLLANGFTSVPTHWNGHTILCGGDACALCQFLAVRSCYYTAVSCQGHVSLLEVGGATVSAFEMHAGLLHGGLRPGLEFELWRKARNMPVQGEIMEFHPDTRAIDPAAMMSRVMALYKMPPINPSETLEEYGERLEKMACLRAEHVAGRLKVASSD